MRWNVVLRNAAGREQLVVIHDKPTGNAAANKAVREAHKRDGAYRWYVVSVEPRGSEIRA